MRSLDLRGHGGSGGRTTVGGDGELLDLDAAVRAARHDGAGAVVTVGFSMGGGVALRSEDPTAPHHSQARGGVLRRGPAAGAWRETRPLRRVQRLLETASRRFVASRLLGVRLGSPWQEVPVSPLEAATAVAPVPLLLVHGDRDEYFPVEHFRALARAAGPAAARRRPGGGPAAARLVVPGLGHAENGVTAPLVELIGRWASATIHP